MEQSLHFYYEEGAVALVSRREVASWRVRPWASVTYMTGGCWRVEREGQDVFHLQSGQACCTPAGVRSRTVMATDEVARACWAHFNIFWCDYVDLLSFFEMPPVFSGEVAVQLGDILAKLAEPPTDDEPFSPLLRRKALEFELAATLIEAATPRYRSEFRLEQIQRIMPVLRAIGDDLAAGHTRESLAKIAHLSPSHFAAVFKQAMGMTPIDYIVKLRMQHARQLLLHGALSVERIAADLGYQDAFYFSRLFKAHCGLSPKKYQTAIRGELSQRPL